MIPSYPSTTFPNHYTLVTGLYPEHHGIVQNGFYDPERKQTYDAGDPKTAQDGSWYGGTPLWVLAEEQGMRSACFFWPGSEAEIQGVRPTYYLNYKKTVPNDDRVAQVIAWLRLPSERRPHLITLYFSDTDDVGHQFGPLSPQMGKAIHKVDRELAHLLAGIRALRLPVDIIVVSDHGMAQYQGDFIDLAKFDPKLLTRERRVGTLIYPHAAADAAETYAQLRDKSDKFVVYRRSDVPPYLHFSSNARIGDPVIVTTGPCAIRVVDGQLASTTPIRGNHGYDPARISDMKAIFFAIGPDIKSHVTVPPFQNVDVYPLIAHILDLDISSLKTGPIDGKLSIIQNVLKSPEGVTSALEARPLR